MYLEELFKDSPHKCSLFSEEAIQKIESNIYTNKK